MSFSITLKSCTPIVSNIKVNNLYCQVQVGDQIFKTPPFKGKGRTAVWGYSFSVNIKESFMKINLMQDGFFNDKLLGDCIINLSKFYSSPGRGHTENIEITKDYNPIAQILIDIQYARENQTQPVSCSRPSTVMAEPFSKTQQQKIQSIVPKSLYSTPVPYGSQPSTIGNSSVNQAFERSYPVPQKGSYLYPSEQPIQPNSQAFSHPLNNSVAYMTQFPNSGAQLVDPATLVQKYFNKDGMQTQPMYGQPASNQYSANQNRFGWF